MSVKFSTLQSSSFFCNHIPTVALLSCCLSCHEWSTVLCCCSTSASRFNELCAQRCPSAHNCCHECLYVCQGPSCVQLVTGKLFLLTELPTDSMFFCIVPFPIKPRRICIARKSQEVEGSGAEARSLAPKMTNLCVSPELSCR